MNYLSSLDSVLERFYLKKSWIKVALCLQIVFLSSGVLITKSVQAQTACSSDTKLWFENTARKIIIERLAYLLPTQISMDSRNCLYSSSESAAKVFVQWKHPSETIYYSGAILIHSSSKGIEYKLMSPDRNLRDHINKNYPVITQAGFL